AARGATRGSRGRVPGRRRPRETPGDRARAVGSGGDGLDAPRSRVEPAVLGVRVRRRARAGHAPALRRAAAFVSVRRRRGAAADDRERRDLLGGPLRAARADRGGARERARARSDPGPRREPGQRRGRDDGDCDGADLAWNGFAWRRANNRRRRCRLTRPRWSGTWRSRTSTTRRAGRSITSGLPTTAGP